MFKVLFSPKWFYGIDSLFETISLIVAFLIFIYANRIYKFSNEKKFKYFSLSFLSISIAYLFKILSNIQIYYYVFNKTTFGAFSIITRTLHKSEVIYNIGILGYWFFLLLGIFGIFAILYKVRDSRVIMFFMYFLLVTCIASSFLVSLYHLTAFLFLLAIYINSRKTYCKTKNVTSKFIMLSFLFLLLGHFIMIFLPLHGYVYVLGETLNLISYCLLLTAFMQLVK